MGLLAEAVRTHPDAIRSSHPHRSFAGWGPAAADILAGHALDDPVGEGSPLSALYAGDASILLAGVGYDKCTALHLAESRSGLPPARVANGAPLLVDGERQWVQFTEPVVDDTDFAEVGASFEEAVPAAVRLGSVGRADSRLVRMTALVDFAANWMLTNRSGP
jgi:aminoglycoside 3-N-acetyltransferase